MMKYILPHEKEIGLTKNCMVKFIDDMILTKKGEEGKLWETKIDKEGMKCFYKRAGSQFSTEHPFFHMAMLFKANYSMSKVIDAVLGPTNRPKWDKATLKYDI